MPKKVRLVYAKIQIMQRTIGFMYYSPKDSAVNRFVEIYFQNDIAWSFNGESHSLK